LITPEGLDVDLIVCEVSRHFNVYDYFISGGDLVFSVSPIRDLKRDFMPTSSPGSRGCSPRSAP